MVWAPKSKRIPPNAFTGEQVFKLVAAAQAARSTFDSLRREGTSFSREAYIRGYNMLVEALADFEFIRGLK